MEKYFLHLDKIMPGKPADMIAKYIPSEIEQTTKVTHNVLVVNMPEPRTPLPATLTVSGELVSPESISNIKELPPIVDVECEDTDRGDPLFNRIKHDTELDTNDLASREG
jgi:hypothetical protein